MTSQLIQQAIGMPPEIQRKVLLTLLVLGGFFLVHQIVSRLVRKQLRTDRGKDLATRSSRWIFLGLSLFLAGRLWFEGVASLSTFLGIFSAGLAIALRDLFVNFAGWLFILGRRPFTVGQRVQVGAIAGDVVEIQPFQFSLMEIGNWVHGDQMTGRMIHLPNSQVFTQPVANYDQGFPFIFEEIRFTVTFESDWRKAKHLARSLALAQSIREIETASPREKGPETPSNRSVPPPRADQAQAYTRVTENGVEITLRYLCEPRRRREMEDRLFDSLLATFEKESDIRFAYATRRMVYPEEILPPAPTKAATK